MAGLVAKHLGKPIDALKGFGRQAPWAVASVFHQTHDDLVWQMHWCGTTARQVDEVGLGSVLVNPAKRAAVMMSRT